VPAHDSPAIDLELYRERLEAFGTVVQRLDNLVPRLSPGQRDQLWGAVAAAADAILDIALLGGWFMWVHWDPKILWLFDVAVSGDWSLTTEFDPLYNWDYFLQTRPEMPAEVRVYMATIWVRRGIQEGKTPSLPPSWRKLASARSPSSWADWRPPDSSADYLALCIELSRALLRSPQVELEAEFQRLLEQTSPFETIDGERFGSLLIQLALTHAPVPAETLRSVEARERYRPERQPRLPFHNVAPPLIVSLARGWTALGRFDLALDLLNHRRDEVPTTDPLSLIEIQRGWLEVVRRGRFEDQAWLLSGTTTELGSASVWYDTFAAIALCGWMGVARDLPAPPAFHTPLTRHAWWRTQHGLKPAQAEALAKTAVEWGGFAPGEPPGNTSTHSEWHVVLDAEEAAQLIREFALDSYLPLVDRRTPAAPFNPAAWLSAGHATEVDHAARLWMRAEALGSTQGEPGDWKHRLGTRRLAEIALDEGELLALRLPALATKLLRRAMDWYREAGDDAGELSAAIVLLVAALHAGHPAQPGSALRADVGSAYERCRGSRKIDGLPSWRDIEAAVAGSDPAARALTPDSSWRFWLLRLTTALVYLESIGNAERWFTHVLWLRERYGGQLPIELDYSSVPPVPEPAPPPASAQTTVARVLDAVAALGGRLLFRPSLSLVTVAIKPAEAPLPAEDQVRDLAQVVDAKIVLTIDGQRTQALVRTPGLRPYAEAARDIPATLASEFVRPSRAQRVGNALIALEVDESLAALPWEAVLRLATSEPLRFFRAGPALPGSDRIERAWNGAPFLVAAKRWSDEIATAWRRFPGFAETLPPEPGPGQGSDCKLLHIIARPVYAAAEGHTVAVDPAEAALSPLMFVSRFRLLREGLPLVIVQDEPAEEPTRFDSDRERTARLRAYAHDLFLAGARSVVMIPSLPPRAALQVVETLAREIAKRRKPPDARTLADLAEAVRAVIRGASGGTGLEETPVRVEPALDVTVFARQNPETSR
jgi:hypothetical protein